ncbi:hypothetical protein R3I93_008769 [Phoxinus phoxinus]|uniref:Uncharacterized protein n=1 Tax=Phoxinus phoxinus TaxID=58324 RepID=A0AAN9H7J7_9TELE
MRPSSILTFEPGPEHGVPWGRDLFTFVTSAAGHMMRTLQKPRKNKPSKRQVNHRRFLHNMIQRKFAEIEAANHKLASALFSTEKLPDHLTPTLSRIAKEVTDQSPKPSKKAIETFINADKTEGLPEQQEDVCDLWTSDSLMETNVADKSFSQCKSFNSTGTNLRTEKNCNAAIKHNPGHIIEGNSVERQPPSSDLESFEESVSSWLGSIERTYPKPCLSKHSDMKLFPTGVEVSDLSPTSPVISLLSLDSCDLEVQMLIDAEHGVQTQDRTIVESLQMDIIDDFELLDCYDNHEDLLIQNSDPKYKMAEWMVRSEEDLQEASAFPSSLDSDAENLTGFGVGTSNLSQNGQEFEFDVLCNQEPHRRSFHHNQTNYSMNHNNILEGHFGRVEPCTRTNGKEDGYSDTDVSALDGIVSSHHMFPALENQLDSQSKRIDHDIWEQQPLKSSHKNSSSQETDQYLMMQDTDIRNFVQVENLNQTGSGLQCPIMCCLEGFCYHKGESCFYSKFRGNQSSHNFEGVARSFPATLHKIHPTPIPTPPLDDDWLFSNIVAEDELNNTFGKYRSVTGQ